MKMTSKLANTLMDCLACVAISANGGVEVDKNGNPVPEGVHLDKNGDLVDANGNYLDQYCNPIAEGVHVENGQMVDKNGNPVASGVKKNADGQLTDLNGNPNVEELKKQLLTPPGDAEVSNDYYGYFDAVNGSESGTVKFVLNEDGSNTVATAEAAANADALEAVLAATTDSTELSIKTPVAGFYYSLKQSDAVTTLGFNDPGDANKLATGKNTITFELEKPENAGFYQTIVTPVPVK